jgi:anaerobic selenocysteine-containing dehydrogenase
MICKVCGFKTDKIFDAKIMSKYKIDYFYCQNCGFLQTEEPYWLDEAYKHSITVTDTGYMQRNIYLSKITTILLLMFFDYKKKFLDYAGGYGVFVRLMRDIGFDFYWYDKYTQNLFARGFEYDESIKGEIEAITCFEAFEHFVNPIEEIENMLSISKNIIFTTELLPNPIPKPQEWWYYTLESGQHISFYSKRTLEYISKKYGLIYTTYRNVHLLTSRKINPLLLKMVISSFKLELHKLIAKVKGLKNKTWYDFEDLRNRLNKHA